MDPNGYGFLWLDVDISWITLASPGSYGLFMAPHGSSMDYNAPGITLPSFNDSKLVPHGNVMDHYVLRWLVECFCGFLDIMDFIMVLNLWLQLVLSWLKMVL